MRNGRHQRRRALISASQNLDGGLPDFRPAQRAMGMLAGVEPISTGAGSKTSLERAGVSVSITTTFPVRDLRAAPASGRSMLLYATRLRLTRNDHRRVMSRLRVVSFRETEPRR